MSTDYEKGYTQFAEMVGEENMQALAARFRAVCPDFEQEVISVVGGRIWTRAAASTSRRARCAASACWPRWAAPTR